MKGDKSLYKTCGYLFIIDVINIVKINESSLFNHKLKKQFIM